MGVARGQPLVASGKLLALIYPVNGKRRPADVFINACGGKKRSKSFSLVIIELRVAPFVVGLPRKSFSCSASILLAFFCHSSGTLELH